LLEIDADSVYTIGDNKNDYGMIQKYHGYMMQNGYSGLKKVAIGTYLSVWQLINDLLNKKSS